MSTLENSPSPVKPDWTAVKALFDEAMALDVSQREAHVRTHAVDAGVAAEVFNLLAHATSTDAGVDSGFLSSPASAVLESTSRIGQTLGAWRLVRELGAGGMGEVFLAERGDGSYVGQAAVKVLKRGMDSASVLARFDLERQSLARLDHPNIARLLDAGLTPDGLPYFVMEHVSGVSIDTAVEGLGVPERLRLFLQLADAVAHAHRNLLVHRDLKPSNVLVSESAQVKLLDFGIAKAIDPSQAGLDQTRESERPYTPSYASPEQVRGEPVTTATDIYSLGVLLYVLLTGAKPYARQATSAHDMAQAVLNDAPTKPSSLSAQSTLSPGWEQTRKRLTGDLDTIVLKALAKPVLQRYASVDAFASDIKAHLSGHPISARPQTWAYLCGRFVSRNKLGVGLAGAALVGVLMSLGVAIWQAQRASEQAALARVRFDDVHRFARTMLFEVDTALREGPTAGREKLVTTALQYLDRLASPVDGSVIAPDLLRDLAEAYERVGDIQGNPQWSNLGRPVDAAQSYAKAMSLRQGLYALAPNDDGNINGLLSAHQRVADQLRADGKLVEALPHFEAAARFASDLATRQPSSVKAQVKRIEAERFLASLHYRPYFPSLNNYEKGKSIIESLDRDTDALSARHPNDIAVLEVQSGLLGQLSELQRLSGAYAAALLTVDKGERVTRELVRQKPDNPRFNRFMALASERRAYALLDNGRIDEGLALMNAAESQSASLVKSDPDNERTQRNWANSMGILAEQYDALGRNELALTWYRREQGLLSQLRTKYPQVKFLLGRLSESSRDLAVQLTLNQQAKEAVKVQQGLDASLDQSRIGVVDDADDAKFAIQRARVIADKSTSQLFSKSARDQSLAAAVKAVERFGADAKGAPYNTLLAREYAMGSLHVGLLLAADDSQRSCAMLNVAASELKRLKDATRLSGTYFASEAMASAAAKNCPAASS